MAAKPRNSAVKFVGVSAEEFFSQIDQEVRAGAWADGTELKPHVREALGQLSKAAKGRRRPRYYVFVWSRFIFIKVDF